MNWRNAGKNMRPLNLLAISTLLSATVYAQPATTLKDAYKGIFKIGAAVNQTQSDEKDPRGGPIIAAQFATISPENSPATRAAINERCIPTSLKSGDFRGHLFFSKCPKATAQSDSIRMLGTQHAEFADVEGRESQQ